MNFKESKSWFGEKFNKISKPLDRENIQKKKEMKITTIEMKKKLIKRDWVADLYANKLKNANEMDNF